jgi:alpha-L-fucosidase
MKINGEAIYNTVRWKTPSQWSEGRRDYKYKNEQPTEDWKTGGDVMLKLTVDPDSGYAVKQCFFTYNKATNNLYALLPKWPSGKQFVLKNITLKTGAKLELLETHEPLKWQQKGKNVLIQLPDFDPNTIKSEYAFVIKLNDTGK